MRCDSSVRAILKRNSEPTDLVEILNEQFVSAFTKEDNISLLIQINGVKKTAFWPDNTSSRFLKEMASSTAPALTLIYQASYAQGQTPDD